MIARSRDRRETIMRGFPHKFKTNVNSVALTSHNNERECASEFVCHQSNFSPESSNRTFIDTPEAWVRDRKICWPVELAGIVQEQGTCIEFFIFVVVRNTQSGRARVEQRSV